TNGLPAGTLLEGAEFEICNERTGNKVDTIVTGANGLASSKQLPLGRYTIREIKAPANYGASAETYTAVLEYSGQIVKLEITNKSMSTGVSITKTGPKEAMSGQPVRYVFSKIGNSSNVMLQSFYWRDTLPAAVRLTSVVTGTYNFPGTYKIVYKVNNTGDYRTLADSLSTSQNYTLAASPVALGLASNERVTEIMFVFGQVPGGFAQVEAPALHCIAISGLAAGSSFANVADVGGTYNGVWVQAVSRWVTTVYGKKVPAPKLPRTGY
ncbi:SpaA isopeptide-forming pilin-related protein, partial [uncultured Oscillibacter sp.]|uniref:SpaA isopeptide-forming pilin-related protein n=1 Tax=uncultured Oscillibacter sp. TaxID=876091 RepID=UPI0026260A16